MLDYGYLIHPMLLLKLVVEILTPVYIPKWAVVQHQYLVMVVNVHILGNVISIVLMAGQLGVHALAGIKQENAVNINIKSKGVEGVGEGRQIRYMVQVVQVTML